MRLNRGYSHVKLLCQLEGYIMDRRNFLKYSALTAASLVVIPRVQGAIQLPADGVIAPSWDGIDLSWSNNIPPLFITAYIDPSIRIQKNQEAIVAKYPLALVPQTNRLIDRQWRDKVKSLNPDIKMLAYQMVIEQTTVPGPGHDVIRKLPSQWVTYPGGIKPYVNDMGRKMYLHDPRSIQWQNGFIKACEATLQSYPYDGLYLDQCTIFNIASVLPSIRLEMLNALNTTLDKLRIRFPDTLIIANSSNNFSMLNGELNENRASNLISEASDVKSVSPVFNFHQRIVPSMTKETVLRQDCAFAFKQKCFFGVAINYQKAEWPTFFNEIVAQY